MIGGGKSHHVEKRRFAFDLVRLPEYIEAKEVARETVLLGKNERNRKTVLREFFHPTRHIPPIFRIVSH